MTIRGRRPKPTALRIFEGNPGKIPINQNEPHPKKLESLECVDWMLADCEYMQLEKFPLHQVTTMIWDKFAPELQRIGVLTEIDRDKFARYCETFARWLKMKSFIDRNGEAFPVYAGQFEPQQNSDGTPLLRDDGSTIHKFKKVLKKMQLFPQVSIYKSLANDLHSYEAEFGIGAASRSRIQTVVKSTLSNGGVPIQEVDEFDYATRRGLRVLK